jgi:ABC-type antimicrobial peptide transport system permease subunit
MKRKVLPILICVLFGVLVTPAYSFITLNNIECAFKSHPEKSILKANMVEGSEHYLIAKSKIALLLAEYEKAAKINTTISYSVSLNLCDQAIEEMGIAVEKYKNAKRIGERIGYNPVKVTLLRNANYNELQNGHNQDIYNEVVSYLQSGDILGIYQKNLGNMKDILTILGDMRNKLANNISPAIDDYWKLTERDSEATLFGYLATVLGTPIIQEQCEY